MDLSNPQLLKLIETGIPVSSAYFHSAVNNADNIPENNFSIGSSSKSRRIEMWATSADLLVCKHKTKLFFTPMANVKFGFFKEETKPDSPAPDATTAAPLKKKPGRPFKTLPSND